MLITRVPVEQRAAEPWKMNTPRPGKCRIGSIASFARLPSWGFRQYRRCDVASGTVKWFNPTKGYGFIQPSGGGGKDVFVHISAVERAGLSTLNEGQQVEYEIVSNRGKESAENLKVK